MAQVLQVAINGILLGGIYALLGVGMTMMFGIVKLTNLAHGEFVIIGAYASTLIAQAIGVDPILTLIVTIPLMFLIGMGLQSGLINRVMMIGSEPALLVTFGLSIILADAMLLLFSADAQRANVPYNTASIRLGQGLSVSVLDLIVFGISLLTIIILTLFLKKTYLGRSIRATSDDTQAASLMGVNVKKTYAIAMGIAMATAAIAGLCVSMKWVYYPSSGGNYLLTSFGVVVIGGMGSIPGTLIAGLILGLAQVIGGANYGQLIAYILMVVFLAVRPQGLFSK
jgi:branched-chain amino acid transport system permease protein